MTNSIGMEITERFSEVSTVIWIPGLIDLLRGLAGQLPGKVTLIVDWLDGVNLAELRQCYNGYNFLGEPVYNPFDVLLYLDSRQFRSYWFETGTPTFLINLLKLRRYLIPTLETLEAGEELLSSFDVGAIEPETLLFQAGYLTIPSRSWGWSSAAPSAIWSIASGNACCE